MKSPTPSELEILHILWELREAKIQEVNEKLNKIKPVGYTTTLKLMQLMHQKELVGRRPDGKSHIYYPLVTADETKSSLLDRFVDATFGGSRTSLMMQLLGNRKVSRDELEKIRDYLDKIEGDK